ncbi:MAG: roadblock/LC7 domain-containing protein [Verrucomicrobiota bacterium]|nr:roadblock/LC7 domain-containing protein [Verrucomicrobiota bacterium]
MTFSFLNFLKKPAATKALAHSAHLSHGARLSKTVMPNTTRTVSPQEEFETVPPPPARPRVYSLGAKAPAELPPAVALALEPKVERVISLELRDVVGQVPAGWIRPVSDAEGARRVLLKAAEVEKGMSSGRPSVCLTSIYNQVSEIFMRPVSPSDQAQVLLPFAKVLEQFNNLQTRNDQSRDQSVPQLETPFLRVTMEDNSRFGTTMAPVQICEKPLAKMELATAETIAAAQPDLFVKPPPPPPAPIIPAVPQLPIVRGKDGSRPLIKLPVEEISQDEMSPAPEPETAPVAPSAPTRIPFKISPIGTGVPASERVPASRGPSVPTSDSAPARIPFKLPLPNESSAKTPNKSKTAPMPDNGLKVSLALKPVLMSLPPFQLAGDIKDVPEDARIEIPFSLVQPQLMSGHVTLKVEEFANLLPAEFRKFFSAQEINAPVSLPLQDVLKNLPAASLRMRDDQEEQEKGSDFQTPFAAKAAEDAKRLGPPVAPKPLKGLPQVVPTAPEEPAVAPSKELDAKTMVADAAKMEGVKACAIMFADGLSLAGNLPGEFQAEALCAMGPSFLQRLGDHLAATKLGELRSMTLSCAKAAVTFFMHDNLCLAALHTKAELAADVRERLAQIVQQLSRKYSPSA